MSRFKTYAVVEKSTGEVIGTFLHDSICDHKFRAVNDITAEIWHENEPSEEKIVFLSSSKGNIEKSRSSKHIFYSEGESLFSS